MTDTAITDTSKSDTFRLARVFTKSFVIFGRHFLPIVLVTAAGLVSYDLAPSLALEWIGLYAARLNEVTLGWLGAGALFLATLVGVVTQALAQAMVAYGTMQDLTSRRFSTGQSVAAVLRRPLPVIGVGVCTGIAFILGYVLLIVPAVIVACTWFVSLPVCMAERTGVFQSLARSRRLTRGHRWRVFGAVLPALLPQVAVDIASRFSPYLGEAVDAMHVAEAVEAMPITRLAIMSVLVAFEAVLHAVVYCELRAVQENKIATVFD